MRPGLIERYRERLPVSAATPVVTLGEGGTPLLQAPYLSSLTGCEVLLKVEGANPTGSFKDRGMTLAVSKALEAGARAAVCASTGNTAASAAAYCARAGLPLAVVLPEGAIARGKLAQARVHDARVIAFDGDFDTALALVRELAERHALALLNSLNPDRLEGQKTVAFEIVERLGAAPDWLALPVGNGGNITAAWRGLCELGVAPRLLAGQAAGAAPLVHGRPVERPQTVASAIRIGRPARFEEARAALRESHGRVLALPDAELLAAYRLLAAREGVHCEPASAAPVAALLRAVADGSLERGATVVCVLTGHGLKDPDRAEVEGSRPTRCEASIEALEPLLADLAGAGAAY